MSQALKQSFTVTEARVPDWHKNNRSFKFYLKCEGFISRLYWHLVNRSHLRFAQFHDETERRKMNNMGAAFPLPGEETGQRYIDDTTFLRKRAFPDGIKTTADVTALIALNRTISPDSDGWARFFVDSLTDFIVFHSYPQGSMDTYNADWFVATFAPEGIIHNKLKLALLQNIIRKARYTPVSLRVLALNQLRLAIIARKGAYADFRSDDAVITAQDMDYIASLIDLPLQTTGTSLQAAELAVLRHIDNAVKEDGNHPDWVELMETVKTLSARKSSRMQSNGWLQLNSDMLFGDAAKA
jgi:hypothetical protein